MPGDLSFTFDDDMLDFDPGHAGNGRHLASKDIAGARVHVDMHDGHITGVHGERNGKAVEAFYLTGTFPSETSGARHESLFASDVRCYLCACSDNTCTCKRVPCPRSGR